MGYLEAPKSMYCSREHRNLDHAVVNAYGEWYEHKTACEKSPITKKTIANTKERGRAIYDRGIKTSKLKANAKAAECALVDYLREFKRKAAME